MMSIIRAAALICGLSAALVLIGAVPARSQATEIYTRISDVQVETILRGGGFIYEKLENHVFRFKLSGYMVILFNEETDLQLYSGFTKKTSMTKINEWNRQKRFSRAYLDSEDDAVIESDLNLSGGVTRENIIQFIQTFRHSVDAYADFF